MSSFSFMFRRSTLVRAVRATQVPRRSSGYSGLVSLIPFLVVYFTPRPLHCIPLSWCSGTTGALPETENETHFYLSVFPNTRSLTVLGWV